MKNLSNRTLIDLGKVSYADFVYRRQGTYPYHEVKEMPQGIWINGEKRDSSELIAIPSRISGYANMRLDECIKLGYRYIDTWIPVFKAQLTNSHTLEFTGKKAYQLWALYRKRLKIKVSESPKPNGRPSKKPTKNQPSMQLELL